MNEEREFTLFVDRFAARPSRKRVTDSSGNRSCLTFVAG
jgi:hypothetical protein